MVLSFGEILMRLSPDEKSTWLEQNTVNVYPGGAELNVAIALANWKVPVSYGTVVPKNFLSAQLIKYIEEKKINTSAIQYYGDRIGLYYLLDEQDMHRKEIIQDRQHSSFYNLKPGIINWDEVLQGVRWFHFNAVAASLNGQVAAVYEEALKACAKKSITVSIDLNCRVKPPNAEKLIPALLPYCDVVSANIWSVENILNIAVPATVHSISTKENYLAQAKYISETIMKQFPRCKIIANAFRLLKNDMEYFGTVFGNNNFYSSASYKTSNMEDKTGTGDSFMAGLIYGIYNHLPFQQIINFAAGAAFQKLFIKGESMDKTVDEVKAFILHYH